MCSLLKFRWTCLRGYGVMGVLSWEGWVSHEFSAPHSSKTMCWTTKSFEGARTCLRSSITMRSLVKLRFHLPPGRPKMLSFFVYLFFCVSVMLASTFAGWRQCCKCIRLTTYHYYYEHLRWVQECVDGNVSVTEADAARKADLNWKLNK